MTREFTITRRTYTGSIDFLRGAEVTMAEPGGDRYARVTVRSGRETYYLENVGHDSITTQTLHRTVRWTSDYAHRARDAAQQIDSADPHRALRLPLRPGRTHPQRQLARHRYGPRRRRGRRLGSRRRGSSRNPLRQLTTARAAPPPRCGRSVPPNRNSLRSCRVHTALRATHALRAVRGTAQRAAP